MDTEPYTPSHGQWLIFCVQIDTKYCNKSIEEHARAAKAIVEGSVSTLQPGSLAVIRLVLKDDAPFDFDSVHHLPLPFEMDTTPVVVEMVYKKSQDRCFARIKTDLSRYDGVTAFCAGQNVLEFLEHGSADAMSIYPFTPPKRGVELPLSNYVAFFKQLTRVLWAIGWNLLNPRYWRGHWVRGPLQGRLESTLPPRPWLRYSQVPDTTSFKDFLQQLDETKRYLGLPLYATTLNSSPYAFLTLVSSKEQLFTKQARYNNIFGPPAGYASPPPMNALHVGTLYNTLFFNNYGRHNPNISGRITDLVWNWCGMYSSFTLFAFAAEIQGKKFFAFSAPPADFEAVTKEGLIGNGLGPVQPFIQREFYIRTT
jgi:hypothetical protein